MSRRKKIWLSIIIVLLCIGLGIGIYFLVVNSQNQSQDSKLPSYPNEITISQKGTNSPLDNISLIEEELIELEVQYEQVNNELSFTYKISDETIASVNAEFVLKGLKAGQAFLTVTCNEKEDLSKIIIIEVKDKVIQKGVGSGKSKDDPLFIGNEGSTEPIEIHFIEVQRMYADAVYIKKGLVDVLIDAGTSDDGAHVQEFLANHMEDDTLDLVMVSHTHEDHYGGMAQALSGIKNISMFIDYGGDSRNSYSDIRDEYIKNGSKYYSAKDCVDSQNGAVKEWYLTSEFTCDILNTGHYIPEYGSAGNTESVAAMFKYLDFSYFTAGDLTSAGEQDLIKNESLSSVSLYKASHHGSHGSNTSELLTILDPYCVGISAAITGKTPEEQSGVTGHPAAAAIERIFKAPQISKNHNVYWNGVNGDMCFTSYGEAKDLTFKGSPTLKGYYIKDSNGNLVKVVGEDNLKFIDTKLFKIRGYDQYVI